MEELASFDESAFLNTTSKFYSCRTANEEDGFDNFAAAWSDKTNGETTAMFGRVDYSYISHSEGVNTDFWEKRAVDVLRNFNIVEKDISDIGFGIAEYYTIPYKLEWKRLFAKWIF